MVRVRMAAFLAVVAILSAARRARLSPVRRTPDTGFHRGDDGYFRLGG